MRFHKAVFHRLFVLVACMIVLALAVGFNSDNVSAKKKSAPLTLTYDGTSHTYKGVQGRLYFNHKEISLTTMPILEIEDVIYAPAQELLETVFGVTWQYDEATGIYTASEPDLSRHVTFKAGESLITVSNDGQEALSLTTKGPVRMIRRGEEPEIPCIPVKKLFDALGYTSSWDKNTQVYTIQKNAFFYWSMTDPAPDAEVNHISSAKSSYEIVDNMAFISLCFHGDVQSSFDSTIVNRQDNIITIKIPRSVYLLERKYYEHFGEIIDRMEILAEGEDVLIQLTCTATTEFTYTTANCELNLRLLWDYSGETGKITNFSLSIPRPADCFIDQVSNVDMYDSVKYKKAFKIIIKGDHEEFFKKNPIIINNNSVKKVKVSLNASDNTVIKVTTRSLRGYKISRLGDYFVVLLNKPRKIYKNIIVLDAGHGDFDNGATHSGYHEKNLNLKMIYTLMKPYFIQNEPETKVYWTRYNDSFVTLDDRSKFAAKVGADVFISLHMNSASNRKANGTEVYYSTDNNKKSFSGIRSSDIAERMDDALVDELNMEDRGVKTAGFYVIKRNSVPSILIELGFLSGNRDHDKLTDPTFQKNATKTIAGVITELFEDYSTGR